MGLSLLEAFLNFPIGPVVQDRLERTAALFNLKPTEYAKALLYKDLQVFDEPLDQRRRTWKRKGRCLGEFDEEESQEEENLNE
jgi:hypothetical protein